MRAALLVFVTSCLVHHVTCHVYSMTMTQYDKYFERTCGDDAVLYRIWSWHHNSYQDRQWIFYCSTGFKTVNNKPPFTGYLNAFDHDLNYICGANRALVGIAAVDNNYYNDRRFKLKCKNLDGLKTYNCKWTGWLADLERGINYQLSNTNEVFNGIYSKHSNWQEDRAWKVYKCNICSTTKIQHLWGAWGPCSRRCTPAGGAPGYRTRTSRCTNGRGQPFCAGIRCQDVRMTQICNEKLPCDMPVAGQWGCWTGWSKCSHACGIGTRTRSRACDNPAPIAGGAACVGHGSESQECMTSEFDVVVNAGIAGHNTKVLTNVSPYACTRACLSEKSFACKSFDYQPSTSKCILKNVDSKGVSLTHNGDFTGWMHQDKKCGTNAAIPAPPVPTPAPLADLCHTKNCYSQCGESPYGNEVRTGDHIVIRGMYVDLYAKLKDGSIPTSVKKVTVHAQTVRLNRLLDITYDLEIVARQVSFERGWQMRYIKQWTTPSPINYCMSKTMIADCKTGRRLTLAMFYGYGRVDIIAEGISGIKCQWNGRILKYLPKQDIISLRQSIACANVLISKSADGNSKVADNILSYVRLVSMFKEMFSSEAEAISIGALASQTRDEVLMRTKAGTRYLPVLSQAGYSYILGKYANILKAYDQQYTTVFDSRQTAATRLRTINVMLTQTKLAVDLQKRKANNVAASLRESTLTLEKLQVEFKKSNDALKTAQKTLQAGIETYKRQQIMKSVFGFIAVIGKLIASVATIVIGAVTGNPAMVVGGVGSLISTIAELAKLIQDTIDLAATIQGIIQMAADMKKLMTSLSAPSNPAAVLKSIEKAADMRIKNVVWQNIKNTADIQLGSGTISEIGGCSDFRKALANAANWGQALTSQVITHAELMRTYTIETLALKLATAHMDRTRQLYQTAVQTSSVSNALLAKVSEEVSEVQTAATRTMTDYCATYFYYNFQPCSSEYTFTLSDKLYGLQVKVHKMASDRLTSASKFGFNPPNPFVGVHVLKDEVAKDCYDPAKCPISVLKKSRQVQFSIPLTSPALKLYNRVRVQQVRVFLSGISAKGKVTVQLNNAGTLEDRYKGKHYRFTGVGRQLFFTYSYTSHTTTDYACAHSSVSDVLFQVTPFGQWGLSVLNPASELDLSMLNQVEIYFIGSAITDRSEEQVYPDVKFDAEGEAEIAGACLGGDAKKK